MGAAYSSHKSFSPAKNYQLPILLVALSCDSDTRCVFHNLQAIREDVEATLESLNPLNIEVNTHQDLRFIAS